MTSIYDLVYDYIDLFFRDVKLNSDRKKTIHQEIKKLLSDGWCSDEILAGMKAWKRKHPDKPTIHASHIFAAQRKKGRNLLEYGKFYYHNILRLTTPPPKRSVDYDSGEILILDEPHFLEIRASLTVEDVVAYYCKQFHLKPTKMDLSRMTGTFGYLLKQSNVEYILFMIDEAANESLSEDLGPLRTPLDIMDYERKAINTYNAKKTEAVISGGNKIVRKRRLQRS